MNRGGTGESCIVGYLLESKTRGDAAAARRPAPSAPFRLLLACVGILLPYVSRRTLFAQYQTDAWTLWQAEEGDKEVTLSVLLEGIRHGAHTGGRPTHER